MDFWPIFDVYTSAAIYGSAASHLYRYVLRASYPPSYVSRVNFRGLMPSLVNHELKFSRTVKKWSKNLLVLPNTLHLKASYPLNLSESRVTVAAPTSALMAPHL